MAEETFVHAHSVLISGGNYTWVSSGGRSLDEEREAFKQLYSHVSVEAFHNSRERSREVDHHSVVKVVSSLRPHFQNPSDFVAEDVLKDIFLWFHDPAITRFPSMWVNGDDRGKTAFIAQAVAEMIPSTSFFFTQPTENSWSVASSVIPSIAFQLALTFPHVRGHILHAIIRDPTIFSPSLRVQAQMQKLIIDPILEASETNTISYPNLILIHALEDCDDQDDFQRSFLDACSQALESLKDSLPLKLLVLGRRTTHLSECVADLTGRLMVLRRPIDSGHWLGVEEENYRKEIACKKWKHRFEKEEGSSERFPMTERRMKEGLEQREKRIELREEELRRRERELNQRERQLRELMLMKNNDTSSICPTNPSSPISIDSRQVVPERFPPNATYGRKSGEPACSATRPFTAPSLTSIRSLNSDKFSHPNLRIPNLHSPHSPRTTDRSATMSSSDTHALSTQPHGRTQLDTPHRRYTSDSKLTDRYSPILTPPSAKSFTRSCAPPSGLTVSTSGSSSKFFSGDGDSSYTSSPSVFESGVLQKMSSCRIPTPDSFQAAVYDPECTWKTDENGVIIAGTLEGLVQFLVITIDSQRHKDYRDIFAMACAEVTTPDQLFQIIAHRFQDAKDQTSADVRVGQHNAFLVIEHWLELGYIPSDPNLRLEMKTLCENAIQSNSEAARLYGVKNLQQLITQIMAHTPSSSQIGQEGIPSANLDPHGLAIALSLLEGENYQSLRPSDYVLHLTNGVSENVNKYYETNEKIRLWVIESILQYDDDVHKRADVMTYFIKTALECRNMRNFSSATAIANALYSAAIQRLKVTRKTLTRDKQGKLSTLNHIVNPDSNYRGYWDTLKSASTAEKRGTCIPWLKVHLIEMQEVLNEHPIVIEEEGQQLINLERYITFMERSKELFSYTPPSVGDHHQEEQSAYLLSQLRDVTYPQGTYERLLARSENLEGQEATNRRSRRDQMRQLGFKP